MKKLVTTLTIFFGFVCLVPNVLAGDMVGGLRLPPVSNKLALWLAQLDVVLRLIV